MALINCPECSKEISDKVKSCPHCGYPMEAPAEPEVKAESIPQPLEKTSIKLGSLKANKTIIIVCLAIVALVATIAIGVFIRQQQAAIAAHDEYVDKLKHVQALMLVTAVKAEELANLTRQVWYNTIYEKSSVETNPYTRSGFQYNDDFNDSLRALFSAQETKDSINTINAGDSLITTAMKELQSPTEEFKDCYSTLNELYSCYNSLVKLATNPTGSLQSFTASFNEADDGFMLAYDRLSLQIPDRIMPAESATPSATSNASTPGYDNGEITLDFSFGTRTGLYSGDVNSEGLPDGIGVFETVNNAGNPWKYEGDWENGHWNGSGTATWASGQSYSGEYENDLMQGNGTYITDAGLKYVGTFMSGEVFGEATLFYPDGTHFTGDFINFSTATGFFYDKEGVEYTAALEDGQLTYLPLVESDITSESAQLGHDSSTEGNALFDNVYCRFVNGGEAFDYESVKQFAELSGYDNDIKEPTEDTIAEIKILNDINGDYVYFAFGPSDYIMTVSYYHESSNSEVSLINYSEPYDKKYGKLKTHVIGQSERDVSSLQEQREFLFK